ncbi:WRKY TRANSCRIPTION FACTOR 30-RELATED [Salix koriyanagi]|uniref:WRKY TRANSCRIPTION FACTOR 30-RELATED n=1 Tax=Salix koriyanagi TaxID=2511006 RepID=A0A9Q1AAZ8_9ROSI|nr:WRKY TRANSCRIPTION FACTOR 30-RELATED [Salix koriyanagi]
MDNMGDWEQKNLVEELTLGMELAKQLQIHLNVSSSPRETREMLLQGILTSYEKALSMLNLGGGLVAGELHPVGGITITNSESPPSLNGSPRSEDSDRDTREQRHIDYGSSSRKSMPRWTKKVRVNPGMGLEGPLDDGFSWRKYGQKAILGAKYPRGYYRCTHRNVQGCLATKQVQRSDEDPTIFEITYRGRHTCTQASNSLPPSQLGSENQGPTTNITIEPQQNQPRQENNPHTQELLLNFRRGLKVITEELDSRGHGQQSFPADHTFQFPSTSTVEPEKSSLFAPSMVENNFLGSFPPSFINPSGSATNYYSVSPNDQIQHSFAGNKNFQSSESELTDIISAAASTTTSATVGLDFPYGNVDIDPSFTFDNSGFLS